MTARLQRALRLLIVVPVCACVTACFVIIGRPIAQEHTTVDGIVVKSRTRAHLKDGTTILYPTGFSVSNRHVHGTGQRYAINLAPLGMRDSISVDSIAVMESVRHKVNIAGSLLVSAVGTSLLVGLGALAAVAVFGSCPTIYSDSAGTAVLEAEAFSYSVAPLFETRDVDLLRARPDSTGSLRLEIRNEMLETHYMNFVELLEVEHSSNEVIAPGSRGEFFALSALAPPARAVDKSGRNVLDVLNKSDDRAFESDSALLWRAAAADLRDHIDISHPVTAGTDSVVLLIRLRSSLLSTVIFYDVMLGAQGAYAVDWIEEDLADIGTALQLGSWVHDNMGLSVRVRGSRDSVAREVAKVFDPGPIAWKDVAVIVPVEQSDSLRLRLEFVVDNWRIDRVAIAGAWRSAQPGRIKASRYSTSVTAEITVPQAPLAAVDSSYLITRPSDRYFIHFNTGHVPTQDRNANQYSYLLAAHGYYTEWVRGSWMNNTPKASGFVPGSDALFAAVKGWREKKGEMEASFFNSRIPVR